MLLQQNGIVKIAKNLRKNILITICEKYIYFNIYYIVCNPFLGKNQQINSHKGGGWFLALKLVLRLIMGC